jgi:hypothetical protein
MVAVVLGVSSALVGEVGASLAIIYVPDNYPTIQAAVDAANPSDTIIVKDGTYIENVDVLVCGGGFAGVAAAVSAAKNGAKVLLLEKYGFLGGLVTAALVITTPPLNNGINREIHQRLMSRSVYARCQNSGEEDELHAFDPEILKYELFALLKKGFRNQPYHDCSRNDDERCGDKISWHTPYERAGCV